MNYKSIAKAKFLNRPNRFEADVELDGRIERVHVKNTGRCKEILLPGCHVILSKADNPNRKTAYDLVAAYKEGFGLINIDSQAPNKVVSEWLNKQNYDYVKAEYSYGSSRIDFYMEKGENRYLMEVKGCTLEKDGIGYFPDAPTERGVKHLKELASSIEEGFKPVLAFVIQMDGIDEVRPNVDIHPEFGQAMDEARAAGVEVLFLKCHIREDGFDIISH